LVVDLQGFPIEQLEHSMALLLESRIAPEKRPDLAEPGRPPTLKPLYVIANKADSAEHDEDFEVLCELLEHGWPLLPFSARTGRHMDRLKRTIFDHLQIIRVYAKPPGKEPDMEAPFVMRKGDTVEEFARSVHRDFYQNLKSARIWGSGLFDGQVVSRDHVLKDGDVIELRI
jgi:ribosome-interacting GTPase 1